MHASQLEILILGAGINGAAIARELALQGVGVTLVDTGDIASGATAYSSRLIHGGLRYLEYGEFGLVRESLEERTRLLQLAPQFVRPLQLFVPVRSKWSGLTSAPGRFLGMNPRPGETPQPRGLRLVQAGLGLYDLLARGSTLPRRAAHRTGTAEAPPFPADLYPWACSYWDAQITYPERFTLALLEDARRLAEKHGAAFRVFTYHTADLAGRTATIRRVGSDGEEVVHRFEPAAVVNATGAWVDATLRRLHVAAPRLTGGTKGSHLISHHRGLRTALAGRGVYAEAGDGRPVFLLPFGEATLIGTTDLPFEQAPETAVAAESEIAYLLEAANGVFPQLGLARGDVALHYSGVRPLPYVDATTPAAVTRRHFFKEHDDAPVPLFSVIGGKLTTCRSLAEEAATAVLTKLGRAATLTTRERPIPGGEYYPRGAGAIEEAQIRLARDLGYSPAQIETVWRLCGTQTEAALTGQSSPHAPREENVSRREKTTLSAELPTTDDRENLPGTSIPLRFVRHSLRREWPRTLPDLVERRLMLHFHDPLTPACLVRLAELMIEAELLQPQELQSEIDACRRRLAEHYGKQISGEEKP